MELVHGGELAIVGRLVFASVLGALIGLERDLRGHPAGIRTMALVMLGAALFSSESVLFPSENGSSRIASNIVVGIGFIGGGVIVQDRMRVSGVTTAATIWAGAAIGIAIGRELYLVALVAALLTILLLEARPVSQWARLHTPDDDNEDD
jgi:putative Mg2+ transporter-C (MgtC) family protein